MKEDLHNCAPSHNDCKTPKTHPPEEKKANLGSRAMKTPYE